MDTNQPNSLFTNRHRRCDSLQEAIEGAANHLLAGKLTDKLADLFAGGFGPEPSVTFQITIRRDPKTPGTFAYQATTKVTHGIGEPINLYALKP